MSSNNLDYRKIRRKAEARLQRDKMGVRLVFFLVTCFMLVFFAIMAWGMFNSVSASLPADTTDTLTGAMIMLTMAGGVGALFHFISFMFDTKAGGQQMRERAYGRALNEEMMRLGEDEDSPREKVKHMMHLSADGELEEIVDDEAQEDFEPQTQRQKQR